MEFLTRLKSTIEKGELFRFSETIVIGVSGGVDSVVLTRSLHQLGYSLVIAHCNFQLRGEESDQEEVFVRELAADLQVPFFVNKMNAKHTAESLGVSIQMAARSLRYEWFEQLRIQTKSQAIVTAHHQNDLLETVLLNLVRGTGLAGFHGIKAKSGRVARPLLFATREDIIAWANYRKWIWKEDSSNASNKYARNLIRNKVIPLLKQLNPSVEKTILHTAEKVLLAEQVLSLSLEDGREKCLTHDRSYTRIHIEALLSHTYSLWLLSNFLEEYGFNLEQTKRIIATAHSTPGALFYSATHRLLKDRSHWILDKVRESGPVDLFIQAQDTEIEVASFVSLKIGKEQKKDSFSVKEKAAQGYLFFDLDKLQFPLRLRTWQKGDKFAPFGMSGAKMVSDLLVDLKLSLFEKEKVLVLVSAEEVLGVVGFRAGRLASVSEATKTIYTIQVKLH